MGLYDIVELPDTVELPDFAGNPTEIEWQSKTLQSHPCMDVYKLTSEGRLLKEDAEYEQVPEEDRPNYDEDIGGFKNEIDEMFGSISKERHGWDDTEQHGIVEIHGVFEDTYYSYELKFTDGELVDIKQ